MKKETKEKLRAINKDVPSIIKQKAKEKLLPAKDPIALYAAAVEIMLVFGLVIALYVWENPAINFIPDRIMPFWEKTAYFALFAAIAALLFFYNRKFFAKASRGVKWQWKWKTKR